MPNKPIAGFHLVRFGTAADQKFLIGQFLSSYDQLIINANMVAHMPGALASFLSLKAKNKPYFIDPQTHAFQHDRSFIETKKSGELKRSITKLIDAYGEPFASCILKNRRPVIPNDFSNQKIVKRFCERVLKFQLESLSKEMNQSDSAKYYKYLKKIKKDVSTDTAPSLVIAPYFYLTANTLKSWVDVNLKCANVSKNIADDLGIPLAVQVVISQDILLDQDAVKQLIGKYSTIKPDLFLIWIDGFSEQQASAYQLDAYKNFIRGLGKTAKVVNLFGGFCSIALGRAKILSELVGVAHGLEYGEDRGVVPVGGGIPVAKFYLPCLHYRLRFRDALRAIRTLGGFNSSQAFYREICGCKICTKVIDAKPEENFGAYGQTRSVTYTRKGDPVSMEYPLPETKEKTVQHYMWVKKAEYNDPINVKDVIKNLNATGKKLEAVIGLDNVAHCFTWSKILEG
ncbi:MAG: hypothetical protein H6754_08925 [Candidatus Omnitrophica bacterium]|nr:hypothetical protein [Candidatus Omnitrophota bacterium]